MADGEDLLVVVARVRRAMPRNPDVMAVCDAAERLSIQPKASARVPFDRKAYQREYMRKRRAKQPQQGG